MGEYSAAVIINNGSFKTQAGFCGEDVPRTTFPSVVGHAKSQDFTAHNTIQGSFVGNEAISKRWFVTLKNPIENGIITNWDDMEKIWEYTYQHELSVNPKDYPVLLSEPPLNPTYNREKMTEIMFEKLGTPAMFPCIPSLLTLYDCGLVTGMVVDCGHDIIHTVPIHKNCTVKHAIMNMNIAGSKITDYLASILKKNGIDYGASGITEKKIVNEIKEKICYVALDFEQELATKSSHVESYELPDGQEVTIGNERFLAPEVMFKPSLLGMKNLGIHEIIYNSILHCDSEIRQDLCDNLVLTGGTSLLPGLGDRLQRELVSLSQGTMSLKIVEPKERENSVWVGAGILASLSTFQQMCFSKKEYDESGPGIVHRKCF